MDNLIEKKKDDEKNDLKKYQKIHRIINKKHPTAPLVPMNGGVANIYGKSINNAFFNRAMGNDVDASEFEPSPTGLDTGTSEGSADAGSGESAGGDAGGMGEEMKTISESNKKRDIRYIEYLKSEIEKAEKALESKDLSAYMEKIYLRDIEKNKKLLDTHAKLFNTKGEDMEESKKLMPTKKINEARDDSTLYFSAFITNLGKYNEGELVGDWVEFPIDEDEVNEILKSIGIGSTDEFGQPYEEWFITDYDTNSGIDLGEYASYDDLEEVGNVIEEINRNGSVTAFRNAMEVCDGSADAIALAIDNGEIVFYDGVTTDSDLGYALIDEMYGDDIPESIAEDYIDFEALGRDLRLEYYPEEGDPETAGEYFCGDENATDSDIGYAFFDMVGGDISNKGAYFDYEAYGRDCRFDGFTFTSDGCIWDGR